LAPLPDADGRPGTRSGPDGLGRRASA
jgi:hypothetical protein